MRPLLKAVGKNMIPSLSVPVSRLAMSICTDDLDALYKKIKPKAGPALSAQSSPAPTRERHAPACTRRHQALALPPVPAPARVAIFYS